MNYWHEARWKCFNLHNFPGLSALILKSSLAKIWLTHMGGCAEVFLEIINSNKVVIYLIHIYM